MNYQERLHNMILLFLCGAVVLLSIAIKLISTSGYLLPGLDGAFYWIQVRSIIENGVMAYPDLQLVFWLQSMLAKIIGDIPLAVRLSDAILPTLAAIPIVLLHNDNKAKKFWFVLPLMLIVVLLHPIQLYYFTGDFIKNEAALPLIFLLGWLLMNFNPNKKWRYILGIMFTLLITALSHFGVLILGLVITFLWITAYMFKGHPWQRMLKLSSMIFLLTLVAIILFILVPDRFDRLLGLLENLSIVTVNPMGLLMLFGVREVLRPDILFAVITGQLGSIAIFFLAWRSRKELSFNTLATIVSLCVTSFIFSSSFIGTEWALRLTALSFAPLFLGSFVYWSNTTEKLSNMVIIVLTSITIIAAILIYPVGPTSPVLNKSEWQDFEELIATVELERPSIVVARHGVDFLTAWYLNTHVAAENVVKADVDNNYRSCYLLEEGNGNSTLKSQSSEGIVIYENETFKLIRIK